MAVADNLEQSRAGVIMIHGMPYNAEAPPAALDSDITPTEYHYIRSNFAVPAHEGALEIGGAVANPITLTLPDLRAMPAVERAVTLECAGNGRLATRPLPTGEPWGDYAVSTALWTGVPLRHILEQAQPDVGAVEVLARGADHGAYHLSAILADTDQQDLTFERALSLAVATDEATDVLIAYEMNGSALPAEHGFPARLVVPGFYGTNSVKWITRMTLAEGRAAGPFTTRAGRTPTC